MHIESFRNYCLEKKGVTEAFPFDSDTLVFKVMGKMFALTDVNSFASLNLKCDPALAIELRERYGEVTHGYHMNKKHWNTIMTNGTLPDSLLIKWIDHSYDLVVKNLPKNLQKALEAL